MEIQDKKLEKCNNSKQFFKKFNYFLQKSNYFYSQLFFLVVLGLFSAFSLCGIFLYKNALFFRDRTSFYSFFYDILHSLNYFGEIPFWNPAQQNGFPQYYTSILGLYYTNPLFSLIAAICWFLGQFNIYITSFVRIYVIYYGILIPFVFLIGLWLLARQLFKSNFSILLILILGSFSPGLIINITDIGFEQTAYGLIFAAAFLKFFKEPKKTTFLGLFFSSLLLAISLNYMFLFWNIIFIPIFVILVVIFNYHNYRTKKTNVPRFYWILLFLSIVLCSLPTMFTFSQGKGIIRKYLPTLSTEYFRFGPGNPLQFLTVSTPGVGFGSVGEPVGEKPSVFFQPLSYEEKTNFSYNYMGILTLPLVIIGLIFGKRNWRYIFFILLAASCLIINLSGYSPILFLLLTLRTPLSVMSHYGDLFFQEGAFCLLIFSAAMGFEVLVRYRRRVYFLAFITLFIISSLFSVMFFIHLYKTPFSWPIFGFALAMIFFYLIILIWLLFNKNPQKANPIFVLLLFLILIDVSTVAFWHMREKIWYAVYKNNLMDFRDPPVESIGIPNNDDRSWYARTFLSIADILNTESMGIDFDSFPLLGFYTPRIMAGLSKGNGFEQIRNIKQYREYDKIQPIKFYFTDINGDKKTDILFYDNSRNVWVETYADKGYTKPQKLLKFDSPGVLQLGDVNGDNLNDVLYLDIQGNFYVALSNGNKFLTPSQQLQLHPYFHKFIQCADINGDEKQDVFFYDMQKEGIFVSFSDGTGFSALQKCFKIEGKSLYKKDFMPSTNQIRLADVNGDRKADFLFIDLSGNILVALSNGEGFNKSEKWIKLPVSASEQVWFADVNGDMKAEIIYMDDAGSVYVGLSRGNSFSTPIKWLQCKGIKPKQIQFIYINQDKKNDILISNFFSGQEDIKITKKTYNNIQLRVTATEKSLLFYCDAYYPPYWYSTVNGKATKIEKMFLGFKGVVVPAGNSEIVFKYKPPFLFYSLILAYLAILTAAVIWIIVYLKEKIRENLVLDN